MFPFLFKFGPLEIRSYGFFVALGFLLGILISLHYAKKEKIERGLILDLSILVILAAIVGARLFYVLGQWRYYLSNPLEIIMVQNGGLVFLGGFVFCFLTIWLFAKIKNINLLQLFDSIAPGTIFGYAIGRIGCFLNGCCFGCPTKLPWGISFPANSLAGSYFPGEALQPTQLYSVLAMFAAFALLFWLYQKKSYNGQILFWALILYSIYRFLVEFLRYSPIHWLGLTPSQWLVIFTFTAGVWGIIYAGRILRRP